MSRSKLQSAIKEVRDQLFLDTADDIRLDVVSSNLGLDRPVSGFDDDQWRYVVKEVALQAKQVRNIFHRVAEVCIGPQKSRIGTLDIAPLAGEKIVQLVDSSNILQVGTLVFDPGLAMEETVEFCFRDLETNKVFLNTPLLFNHSSLDPASTYLDSNHAAGVTSLSVVDSDEFPTTGFPYSIIVDRGTEFEETLVVTANNTSTDTLTLQDPTLFPHSGPKATFLRKALNINLPVGWVFVKLDSDETRNYPSTGFVRLAFGTGTEETVEFSSNDVENDVLQLRTPLKFTHASGESVELVNPGAVVETCSVLQLGIDWSIHETRHNKVLIFIPDGTFEITVRDASYLHAPVLGAFSTSLTANLNPGDNEIEVLDTSGFPEVGVVNINGTHIFYTAKDDTTDKLFLPTGVTNTALIGNAVSLVRHVYLGTADLEEGNLRNSSGVIQSGQFPGPYLYDPAQYAPTMVSSFLNELIPPPTTVVFDQILGTTSLEVADASEFPVPPFSPYDLRVGSGTAFVETTTVTDRTLRTEAATTVSTNAGIGVTSLQGANTVPFPEGNGTNPARYRIIVDQGGPNEEILLVEDTIPGGPGTFLLIDPTTIAHSIGETIELMSDVLTVDTLTQAHPGPQINPSVNGHLVEKLIETITLNPGGGALFPDAGVVYINFGKERLNVRQKIVSATPTIITMIDSSLFPTTDFPYKIVVGEGLPQEEVTFVTANNTGLNQLTVSPALVGTFPADSYVEFAAGVPTTLEYIDKVGDVLELSGTTALSSGYTNGERVMLTGGLSEPDIFGNGYAFLLPPDPSTRFRFLLDIVRAAGVEVIFLTDR